MWRPLFTTCLILVLASPPLESSTETFSLEYKLLSKQPVLNSFNPQLPLEALSYKPERIKKEPKYKAKPFFFDFPFGPDCFSQSGQIENSYILVLDKLEADSPAYDIIYIDKDRDGDIIEESPILLNPKGEFELGVLAGGKPTKHRFEVALFTSNIYLGNLSGDGKSAISITNKGTWMGSFILNGKKVNMTLVDNANNGVYNTPFQFSSNSFFNGDSFSTKPIQYLLPDFKSQYPYPAIFDANGKLYDVTIAKDGSSISFSPCDGPFGIIETPDDGLVLVLITENDRWYKQVSINKCMKVPVGKVHVYLYFGTKTDAKGLEWIMFPGYKNKLSLTIEDGKKLQFNAGQPLHTTVRCDEGTHTTAGSSVRLKLSLKDSMGYNVIVIPNVRENLTLSDSFVTIKQGDKLLIKEKVLPGKLDQPTLYTWHVPENLTGTFTVLADIHTGPFHVEKKPLTIEVIKQK